MEIVKEMEDSSLEGEEQSNNEEATKAKVVEPYRLSIPFL